MKWNGSIWMMLVPAALGAVAGLFVSRASISVSAAETAEAISRAAVWRAIFARPSDRPYVDARKAALGGDLFRDPRLSGHGRASCATCHDPARSFTDGRKTAVGPTGKVLPRNVPALFDLAWATSFFWDGRAGSLVQQARVPIEAADELAGSLSDIARNLGADPAMRARFAAAYPAASNIDADTILDAIATYERTLVSPETRFDRWIAGDGEALSRQELAGFDIFVGKGGCVSCHGGWRFTDDSFHDVGVKGSDPGRGGLSAPGRPPGLPEFKTPSLRETAHTAPYMHDGSLATLEDVVAHYAGGFERRPSLAPTLVQHLELSSAEKAALVAFLKTLSSEQNGHTSAETTRPMPKK